ncbi:MAG TPA: site-specific DNA-methyltransferase, partial [Pilimelia sp.]|nr:site-specific DNA-methyltransferase [Pilimelia sp.]
MPALPKTGRIELQWVNKHLSLATTEAGDHQWAASTDHRVAEVRLVNPTAQVGRPSDNLLVRGDSAHALGSLTRLDEFRDRYRGRVRLCYIDPPFNTGETKFHHYSDAVDRSIWLTMLRDRLVQIRELLAPEGSVWVHLDDAEQHRARCVLDEVFGADAFVATIIWQKRTSRDNRKSFSSMHDYIHVYAPLGPVAWKKLRNALPDDGAFANPDGDPRGPWRSVPLSVQAGHATAAQFYTVVSPAGVAHDPPPGRCWAYSRQRLQELIEAGRIYWPKGGHGKPRLKRYRDEATGLAPFTIWGADEVGDNASAKKALLAAFPGQPAFDTPKPEGLLERIVHVATDPGDLVLDCFLGSGTTAAVAHRMGRRWIGVERNPVTVANFALPRLQSAVERAPDGPGFAVVDVCPSMYETDDSGQLRLASWVTDTRLVAATAAQLGYPVDPEGPFAGRRGQRRLAVI